MRLLFCISVCSIVIITGGCRSGEAYRAYAGSIDSLSGAIATIEGQLRSVNEAELLSLRERYVAYRTFIKQHVTDTISQAEAAALQRFSEAGEQVGAFIENRRVLTERSALLKEQLAALAKDIRSKSVDEERVREYLTNERNAAIEFALASQNELGAYNESLRQFKLSMVSVGDIIRRRNNGELPRVITNGSF